MSYIVISKELFKNPLYSAVSAEAKLLYGFLADRSKLSKKSGEEWLDQNNECFVYYPQTEIMERFCCGHDKAGRLMRELEDARLIQRTRQGLGLPSRLVVKEVVKTANNPRSETRKISNVEREKVAANNTDNNNPDINKTEATLFKDRVLIEKQIKENICYDILVAETDQNILDSIVEVVVETLCKPMGVIRIAGERRAITDVFHSFMALNDMHLRYVIDRIKREENVIFSPKGYILRHLLYADQEMDIYYASRVAHDEKNRRSGL